MNFAINRRSFLKSCAAGSALALFPDIVFSKTSDPHFFINLVFYGGMDTSSTFDARPLKMTEERTIQNYTGKEPTPWTGVNGQTTLCSEGVAGLKDLAAYFTVLNGVVMSPSFDGHVQNLNFLLSGNPFGGGCFLPELNKGSYPLDGIMLGTNPAQLSNMASFIPTTYKDLDSLIGLIQKKAPIDPTTPAWKFLLSRYQMSAKGEGRFSKANELLNAAVPKSRDFEKLIKSMEVKPAPSEEAATLPILTTVGEMFRKQIVRSALIIEDIRLDAHAAEDQAKYSEKIVQYSKRVRSLIEFLRNEPFDEKRSLMDVTTFVVSSEFARTMRQMGVAIDKTGTDHNNFSNTVLIGGRGIKGGYVVGATDFNSSNEVLTGAHLAVDSKKLKAIGQPFDFTTLAPSGKKPEKFEASDYLTIGSVVNTIYAVGGVSETKYWKLGNSNAPVLKGLFS